MLQGRPQTITTAEANTLLGLQLAGIFLYQACNQLTI